MPVSPSGPLVTLGWVTPEPRVTFAGVSPGALRHAPLPAPRPPWGLGCRGRGRDRLSVPAPLSFYPPTACRLPRRPPLPPPTDTPPATLSPPRGHAWLGGRRAPDPPVPLNASRHPPPAAPGARGPRPPRRPPAVATLCAGGLGGRGGRPRPLHFFQECAAPNTPAAPRSRPRRAAATFRACLMTLAQPPPHSEIPISAVCCFVTRRPLALLSSSPASPTVTPQPCLT